MYITLEQAKKHLNIESSYTEDDAYISDLISVAENAVLIHCNILVGEGDTIPSPLKQAMLLMIGHLYQNRELVGYKNNNQLPRSYDYLIQLYQNYDR